ncbi:hypothetical protein [Streptomyces sp. R33]|uniref:Uncharacterized protein n=1 Tax=Streptomyces sp. R33 TaxID=3238629 RepID=A0AB39XYG9_9ACTN
MTKPNAEPPGARETVSGNAGPAAVVVLEPVTLADDLGSAFRSACHGGQLPAAPYLLSHRVDVDRVGPDGRPRWASL